MNAIVDSSVSRNLANCFYLQIPLDGSDAEIKELIANAMKVEQFTKSMLGRAMDFEELLETVEEFIPSMDTYVSEVETNLNQALIWTL